jgi:hypothetical protein
MLTVALLWFSVVIVESEKTVPPEDIFSPFTVTLPETDSSADALDPGAANTTIE